MCEALIWGTGDDRLLWAGCGQCRKNATGYDHAGKFESSILMSLYPDCVQLDRIDDIKHWFTESASEASKELGDEMVRQSLEYLDKKIV